MVRQKIRLPAWEWEVYIYYEADAYVAEEILLVMQMLGAGRSDMARATSNLRSDRPNCGLTFSSYESGASVMVIGKTTSADEFADTYNHEKGHLVKHICQARGIDPYSEEAEYLDGEVSKLLFPCAKRFMCDACRKRARGARLKP